MKIIRSIISLSFLFIFAGCSILNPTPSTVDTATQTATPALAFAFSLDQLQNAQFLAPQYQRTIQLSAGKYEGGSGADYLMVELLPQMAAGDLNNDGINDAAILLAENGGGTGVFVSLVALRENVGGFSQSKAVLIDDRPQINSVTIKDGMIVVDAVIHSAGDTMALPTMKVVEEYTLSGSSLILTGFTSNIAGAERSITIESPSQGQKVNGSVQVKGRTTISPFENNLAYRFYDETGAMVFEGPFPVKSDALGGPATFDNNIPLPTGISAGSTIRLELAELSMADGTYLCSSSVNLIVK